MYISLLHSFQTQMTERKMKKQDKRIRGKIDYDHLNDSIFLFAESEEYKISKMIGNNIIIDFNKDGQVTGLEVLSASKVFRMSKEALRNLKNVKLRLEVTEESVTMHLIMTSLVRNAQREKDVSIEKINPGYINPLESSMTASMA